MATYLLVLYVTLEQEEAIRALYSQRGWQFLKQGDVCANKEESENEITVSEPGNLFNAGDDSPVPYPKTLVEVNSSQNVYSQETGCGVTNNVPKSNICASADNLSGDAGNQSLSPASLQENNTVSVNYGSETESLSSIEESAEIKYTVIVCSESSSPQNLHANVKTCNTKNSAVASQKKLKISQSKNKRLQRRTSKAKSKEDGQVLNKSVVICKEEDTEDGRAMRMIPAKSTENYTANRCKLKKVLKKSVKERKGMKRTTRATPNLNTLGMKQETTFFPFEDVLADQEEGKAKRSVSVASTKNRMSINRKTKKVSSKRTVRNSKECKNVVDSEPVNNEVKPKFNSFKQEEELEFDQVEKGTPDKEFEDSATYQEDSNDDQGILKGCGEKNSSYCPYCDYTYKNKHNLENHKRRGQCQLRCPHCPKVFPGTRSNRRKYKNHLKSHEENIYKCDLCDKTYRYKKGLIIHRRVHSGELPFPCPICGKCFISQGSLKTHKLCKHNKNPSYQCDMCGHICLTRSHLWSHTRDVHCKDPPIECQICHRLLKNKSCLRVHMNILHTENPYRFQCQFCEKKFKMSSSLHSHERRHRKEYRLFCETCQKGFYDSRSLKDHMTIHSGEKPHKCPSCVFRCSSASNLLKHQKVHKFGHGATLDMNTQASNITCISEFINQTSESDEVVFQNL